MSRQISDLDPIESAELEVSDLIAVEDIDVPRTKKLTLGELAQKLQDLQMPLGTLYYNADDDTNPNTLLGFGTWTAFGKGRVPVGASDTDTDFATGGQTGGTKQVTLTTAQIPAHSHGVNDPGHHHRSTNSGMNVITQSSTNKLTLSGSAQQVSWGNTDTTHEGTGISIQNNGGGEAHTNLQPYIVVYIWKRTG